MAGHQTRCPALFLGLRIKNILLRKHSTTIFSIYTESMWHVNSKGCHLLFVMIILKNKQEQKVHL